jgi:heme/copper-type cytochrome/quinol oxidase subunit 4
MSIVYILALLTTQPADKDTDNHSWHLTNNIICLVLFGVFFIVQVAFLFFYFFCCSTFFKRGSHSTFLFDKKNFPVSKHRRSSSQMHRSFNEDQNLMNARFQQQQGGSAKRYIITRYISIHALGCLILSIVPVLIIATGFHAVDNKHPLFTVYSVLALTVSLFHFCSFVQLSSLVKTIIALIFALVISKLLFFC